MTGILKNIQMLTSNKTDFNWIQKEIKIKIKKQNKTKQIKKIKKIQKQKAKKKIKIKKNNKIINK